MAVRPTEISDIIRQQIAASTGHHVVDQRRHRGQHRRRHRQRLRTQQRDGLGAGRLPAHRHDRSAFTLAEDSAGILVLGDYKNIEEGRRGPVNGQVALVLVGDALIGRVVNALGEPIDGKGPIVRIYKRRPIEIIAPGVIQRANVDKPPQTGIKAIDAMIPIGRGQRELIIGDRQTGKTAVALDT